MTTDTPTPIIPPPMASYRMRGYHPKSPRSEKRRPMLLWAGSGVGLVLVGALALSYWGDQHWNKDTEALVAALHQAGPTVRPAFPAHFDAAELATVPPVVRQYLSLALQENQPVVRGLRLEQTGTLKRNPTQGQWDAFTAAQWVATSSPGYVWDATLPLYMGVAVRVRNAYVAGVGSMQPAAMGLFKLAGRKGTADIAHAELMRYLSESVWYPTALLPSQGVVWTDIDTHAAQATLTDGLVTVSLRFEFNAAGLVERISSTERPTLVGKVMVPSGWEVRLSQYQRHNGMQVPMEVEAAWLPAVGARQPYWRAKLTALDYDMPS